ncbi:hypothetical protein OG209_05215 [Streptomyces sp. NBC_01383]|uniref:hypothetical protein n=1 Tax=Streptomyces sp. NBC_01383 TaxID=2903846 RepID=UPI0032431518
MTAEPYCTGDRCADCEPPDPDDPHSEDDCCEGSCGCCPRVDARGHCSLYPGSEENSRYCDQHGERWLNNLNPEAERRHQILRQA